MASASEGKVQVALVEFLKHHNLDDSVGYVLSLPNFIYTSLTLSQTTNLRPFQTESVLQTTILTLKTTKSSSKK